MQSSETIAHRLIDSETKLFFYFLQWILPKFVDLNQYFQNERVVITAVYTKMTETFKDMLLTYLNPNYVHKTNLSDIDPNNASEFINLNELYLGVRVAENINKLNRQEKDDFCIRCRQFLIVSCNEIKKRFDFKENILSQKAIFDYKYTKQKPQSILNIIKSLPRIIKPNDLDKKQKVDDQ